MKQNCCYFGSGHPSRECLVYRKKCAECGIVEEESNLNQQEVVTDTVNINSLIVNALCWQQIKKTSSSQGRITILHKVDTGCDGNIMPLHIYKILFPRATKEQLAAITNTNVQLKTYTRTTATQLGICKIKIEHNNKQRMCNFFVVLGNRQPLLGMPDIEILDILTINCNTMVHGMLTELQNTVQTQTMARVQ